MRISEILLFEQPAKHLIVFSPEIINTPRDSRSSADRADGDMRVLRQVEALKLSTSLPEVLPIP
jgi:hypothetical protein